MAAQTLQRVQASDNLKNLFEVPVLFYALCAVLGPAQSDSAFFVIGAWLYVALRYIHSFIHLTYNRVTHRFAVHALSTAILFVLWGVLGVQVLFLREHQKLPEAHTDFVISLRWDDGVWALALLAVGAVAIVIAVVLYRRRRREN